MDKVEIKGNELIVNGKNVIKPADFQKDLSSLAELRKKVPEKTNLPCFKEKVGLFPAHVKGEDMNGFVTTLQGSLSEINQREYGMMSVIDRTIHAIDSLDKGYLQGIILGIKAGQEADDKAAYAIERIKETLKILKSFKEKLESNTNHLYQIDRMWDDIQNAISRCESIERDLKGDSTRIKEATNSLKGLQDKVSGAQHFKDIDKMYSDIVSIAKDRDELNRVSASLKQLKYLYNIDSIYGDLETLKCNFTPVKEENDRHGNRLGDLETYRDTLKSYVHLKDIDVLWNDFNNAKEDISSIQDVHKQFESSITDDIRTLTDFKNKLTAFQHLNDIDTEWEFSHNLETCVNQDVNELTEKLNECQNEIGSLKQRFKILAYLLGGTATIALIQFILNLVGVF